MILIRKRKFHKSGPIRVSVGTLDVVLERAGSIDVDPEYAARLIRTGQFESGPDKAAEEAKETE